MKSRKSLYHRHRFPQEIIRHAVWLYYRFCLSYRDVEDLLSERGIKVSYETIRRWCTRFGPTYANRLRKQAVCGGDQWFVDEVFVRIDGELQYLYRSVDQDGQVLDIIASSFHTNRLGNARGGCADSNPSVMPSCSYPFMARCKTCLRSPAIYSERSI